MGRFIPSPDMTTGDYVRELAASKPAGYDDLSVTLAGSTGVTSKTLSHKLGKTPTSWRILRAQPGTGVTGSVYETLDGTWDTTRVEFTFPGDGTWTIRVE